MKKYKIFALLLVSVIFISCKKEDIAIQQTTNIEKQNILAFKTIEEFNETLVKVNSMSETERKTWETEQGFKSFGTICDEFYKNIDPKSFKNYNDVGNFVEKNSKYIELFTDANNETYCIPKEFYNAERFILNQDKMYIIGTTVFKKFDEKLIATNIINFNEVYSAEKISDLNIYLKDEQTTPIQKVINTNITEASASGTCVIGTTIWNKDSYKVTAKIKTEPVSAGFYTTLSIYNYSMTLGIWWYIDAFSNYSFSYTVTDSNNNVRSASTSSGVWVTSSNRSPTWISLFYNINNANNPYFLHYNCNVVTSITDSDGTGQCIATMSL